MFRRLWSRAALCHTVQKQWHTVLLCDRAIDDSIINKMLPLDLLRLIRWRVLLTAGRKKKIVDPLIWENWTEGNREEKKIVGIRKNLAIR